MFYYNQKFRCAFSEKRKFSKPLFKAWFNPENLNYYGLFLFIFIVVDTDNNPFRSTFGVHRNTRHIIEGAQSFPFPNRFRATRKALLRQPPQREVKLQKKNICKYLIKMSWKFVHTNTAHHIAAQHRSRQCVRNNENDESAIIPNMMMNSTKIYFYGHIQFLLLALFSPPILRLNFPLFLLIDRIKYGEKSLRR